MNGLHSHIKQYPNVTLDTCGIGRQSLLMTGQCLHYSMTENIQNGRLAEPGEWPWIALILMKKYFVNQTIEKSSKCTGVVLNANWILTNAHCIRSNHTITVRTVYDWRHEGHTYGMSQSFIHPDFQKTGAKQPDHRYDIALVKLVQQIPISNTVITTTSSGNQYSLINGICLPDIDLINTDNELALIAGFGYIDEGVDNYGPLMMGSLMIAKPVYNKIDAMGNWILGYRHPLEDTSAAVCRGDSGGPLVQYVGSRAVLIGLQWASVRKGDCQSKNPSKRMSFMRGDSGGPLIYYVDGGGRAVLIGLL
ncbi:vitamin K-dependent protein C-like [Oppia nitens]|uniref:vitamin K-dependent protein C-like n=1 Tax=Oppia nitens TaxID=1686743 RepID=UPI0023DC045F|nr:vitamin K-dependent protein C-like [Oppia nitens]